MTKSFNSVRLADAKDSKRGTGRSVLRGVVVAGAIAAFVGGMGASASAAPPADIPHDTEASVAVASVFEFTVDSDFSLTKAGNAAIFPGDDVTGTVNMNVETNNINGWTIKVTGASGVTDLVGDTAGNLDNIDLADLTVLPQGGVLGEETPMTAFGETAVTTQRSEGKTEEGGSNLTDHYLMHVPNVTPDTYRAALTYVASATA